MTWCLIRDEPLKIMSASAKAAPNEPRGHGGMTNRVKLVCLRNDAPKCRSHANAVEFLQQQHHECDGATECLRLRGCACRWRAVLACAEGSGTDMSQEEFENFQISGGRHSTPVLKIFLGCRVRPRDFVSATMCCSNAGSSAGDAVS